MSEPTEAQPGVAGHKQAKLTPAQWSEIILLWKQGDTTLHALSARYKISVRRLQEKFKSVGAKKGELIARQAKAQEAAILLEPSELAKRIFDTKNETYMQLTTMRRVTVKMVLDTLREGKRVGTIQADIKAMKDAVATVELCREGAYRILGIHKEEAGDETLPDLTIRGLTQDEIVDLQQTEVEDADTLVDMARRAAEEESARSPDEDDDA